MPAMQRGRGAAGLANGRDTQEGADARQRSSMTTDEPRKTAYRVPPTGAPGVGVRATPTQLPGSRSSEYTVPVRTHAWPASVDVTRSESPSAMGASGAAWT